MSGNCTEMRQHVRGFTLVELVTIMILVGILAAVAIPRMDTSMYHAVQFHDQTVAALRFAQKTAVSHRRLVCVTFANNHSLALTIASTRDGACAMDLPLPGSTSNELLSSDAGTAFFDPLPATLSFYADGTNSGASFSAGGTLISVVKETGYVR